MKLTLHIEYESTTGALVMTGPSVPDGTFNREACEMMLDGARSLVKERSHARKGGIELPFGERAAIGKA
jgi:hypothetical protein